MKIIFSHLKTWLPNLPVDAKTLRDDLTLIGHFASGFEEIDGETVLDLEIRQNRADCLGYYGLARDLATFYKINFVLPPVDPLEFKNNPVPITISSKDVYRIQATTVSNIKNSLSPDWLVNFLKLHDINSINTLVDLSNFVMLEWGIPCHAFDQSRAPNLVWENNSQYSKFISLDGTEIKLQPQNLLVTNASQVLSLSFIGGQNSGIELDTTNSILEMAIYNRSRVRSDSRSLKTITEASIRLDKELDTDTIPLAFSHLVSLIQKHCQATISGALFDVSSSFPQKRESILFDLESPSKYAGIDISSDFALDVLDRLGCIVQKNLVTPPSIRKDITISEDLTEEVIRFYGYNKIPTDSPIDSSPLPDITPPILYLIEKIKDDLVAQGFDEVRSWPLVSDAIDPDTVIKTENSINSDYPYLRQSIIQSLKSQLNQYTRYKLPSPQFFEIGKIFSQEKGKYIEKYALGTYDGQKFSETILDDLPQIKKYLPRSSDNHAIELTSQIITLDANVSFDTPQDPSSLLSHYTSLINPNILWSIEIIDVYQNRYTFRVCYYNCDDKTAKKIHLKTFNLG